MPGRPRAATEAQKIKLQRFYESMPSIRKAATHMRWSADRTRRVLTEMGLYQRGINIRGRSADESRAIYDAVLPLWTQGASLASISREVGISEETINRLMVDHPRRVIPRGVRAAQSLTIPTDRDTWIWIAGVFDAAVTIATMTGKRPFSPELRVTGDPVFINRFHAVIGCGAVMAAGNKGKTLKWQLRAYNDVREVLKRVEPYLRDQGPSVRSLLQVFESEEGQ